jgi:ring-1,2-phenylacetyl-CoA epoxidase subunit PaaE
MSQTYEISLTGKRNESSDAYSLHFNIPEELSNAFQFKAGQYLTIEAIINGNKIRRAYSISSRIDEMPISIVVKRVEKGLMSNHLIDHVSVGDKLNILAPEGRFIIRPEFNNQKQYFFFAAGSGITPIMSMIKTILEFEPKSEISLLYGNRKQEDIIYESELSKLAELYKGQLHLYFTLSKPPKSGLSGLWKKKKDGWDGLKGRIDPEMVKTVLESHLKPKLEAQYYVCGPGEMIPVVKKSLQNLSVEDNNIHIEYFANPDQEGAAKSIDLKNITSKLTITLEGQTIESEIKSEETILNHLIKLGFDPPYSCTSGTCSTCMAKVKKGSVKMDACFALEDSEVKDGYILTCQSHATSEELEVTYEI